VDATGSAMEISGMVMAVIEDGQIQEGWNCFDFMSLYQQVGMLPSLPTGQPPTVA
jgi:predicted ester cyclase